MLICFLIQFPVARCDDKSKTFALFVTADSTPTKIIGVERSEKSKSNIHWCQVGHVPFVSFDKEGIVNVSIKTVLPWFSNIYNERQ